MAWAAVEGEHEDGSDEDGDRSRSRALRPPSRATRRATRARGRRCRRQTPWPTSASTLRKSIADEEERIPGLDPPFSSSSFAARKWQTLKTVERYGQRRKQAVRRCAKPDAALNNLGKS